MANITPVPPSKSDGCSCANLLPHRGAALKREICPCNSLLVRFKNSKKNALQGQWRPQMSKGEYKADHGKVKIKEDIDVAMD